MREVASSGSREKRRLTILWCQTHPNARWTLKYSTGALYEQHQIKKDLEAHLTEFTLRMHHRET